MLNDGREEFLRVLGWAILRLQKLVAASRIEGTEQSELVFYFVRNSKEENAPVPHDQLLAIKYLEAEDILKTGSFGYERESLFPTGYFEMTDAEPNRVEVTVDSDVLDEFATRAEIAPYVSGALLLKRTELTFDSSQLTRFVFIEDENPRCEYRGKSMKLSPGSRYFAVCKVLSENRGIHLASEMLIAQVNKNIKVKKGAVRTHKDLGVALQAIRNGLSAEKDRFFPIVKENNSLFLEKR